MIAIFLAAAQVGPAHAACHNPTDLRRFHGKNIAAHSVQYYAARPGHCEMFWMKCCKRIPAGLCRLGIRIPGLHRYIGSKL